MVQRSERFSGKIVGVQNQTTNVLTNSSLACSDLAVWILAHNASLLVHDAIPTVGWL